MIFAVSRRRFQAVFIIFSFVLSGVVVAADKSSKPDATAPTVIYRSVFRETSLGVEQEKADWRKANEAVGKFTRGHLDILKHEEIDSQAAPAPHKH